MSVRNGRRSAVSANTGLFAILVAFLALALACTTSTADPPRGGGDETVSLQQRLDALSPGDTLVLEPRTYQHTGVLKVRVPNVRIDGNGATLQATRDETSSVQVTADGVSVGNLTLTAPSDGKRWSGLDQQKLAILGARGVSVRDTTVRGSAAAGIFVGEGATGFTLTNITVNDTRADGVHITGGASAGTVTGVTTNRTGDDGVAVVSYGGDPAPCRDITINGPVVNGTNARGVTVVGGEQVAIRDVSIRDTAAAGIYIAVEGDPFYTSSVREVSVVGGSISDANQDARTVHGAVLVYGGRDGQSLQSVDISRLVISDTPASAQRDVALTVDHGSAAGIVFSDIQLNGTAVTPFTTNAPPDAYTATDWTVNGKPVNE